MQEQVKLGVKVDPVEVPKGLSTYGGIGAAVAQFVTALLILITDGPSEASIALFATAAGTLVPVLLGRQWQAKEAIKAAGQIAAAAVAETQAPPQAAPAALDMDASVLGVTDGDHTEPAGGAPISEEGAGYDPER